MDTVNEGFKTFFQQFDKELYVDRKALLSDLIAKLRDDRIVSVVGRTGSGKTTLIEKGLMPRLLNEVETQNSASGIMGQAGRQWQIAFTTPQLDPIGNLARALAGRSKPQAKDPTLPAPEDKDQIADTLKEDRIKLLLKPKETTGSDGLVRVYEELLSASKEPFNLLIVVDQIEELFRFKEQRLGTEREHDDVLFVSLLLTAIQQELPIYTVIVVPSQDIDKLSDYAGLAEQVNPFQFVVPRLDAQEQVAQPIRDRMREIHAPLTAHDTPPATLMEKIVAAEREIISQLLDDYEALEKENDRLALFKLHIGLDILQRAFSSFGQLGSSAEMKRYHAALQQLQRNGSRSLAEVFDHYAQGIYDKLDARQQTICERIFKALTDYDPDPVRIAVRRPLVAGELQKLCFRSSDDPGSMAELKAVFQAFTGSETNNVNRLSEGHVDFLDFYHPGAHTASLEFLNEDTIVDLANDALIQSWGKIKDWVEEENAQAGIYRNLTADAAAYYRSGQTNNLERTIGEEVETNCFKRLTQDRKKKLRKPDPSSPADDSPAPEPPALGLLQDDRLAIARNWLETTVPNQTWANRYKEDDEAGTFYHQTLKYLEESEELDKRKQEHEDAKLAVERRCNSFFLRLMVGVAILVGALALLAAFLFIKAANSEQNLELVNFLDVLLDTKIITEPSESVSRNQLKVLNELRDKIQKDEKINSLEILIDSLGREGFLVFSDSLEDRERSRQALLTIDDLYDALRYNDDLYPSAKKLQRLVDSIPKSLEYRQYPYVYYALNEHVKAYKKKLNATDDEYRHGSLISAFTTNPEREEEYAFSDYQGRVMVMKDTALIGTFDFGDERITALDYRPDGRILYAGSSYGLLFALNINRRSKSMMRLGSLGTPIDFIKVIESNNIAPGSWINHKQYHLDHRNARFRSSSTKIGPKNIRCYVSNGKILLTGGRDRTTVYYERDGKTGTINHPDMTITAMAMKGDTLLAMGSEAGDVWLVPLNLQDLRGKTKPLRDLKGDKLTFHTSLITSLHFNPERPQLASSSLDGRIVLWNLDRPANSKGQEYDHIKLEDRGQDVFKTIYINADELGAAEDITIRKWKTNIEALREELRTLMDEN